ncbi:MAG: hypothetical protein KKH01_00055 [Firmicutes bacterium]|nr:hypothetical protein [Bacillota bacterium]
MYHLVKPTIFYKKKYLEYMKEWKEEPIVPVVSDLRGRRFETLLKELYELEHEIRVPKDYFPDMSYFVINQDDEIIGFVNIRHYLNDTMIDARGHISIGIKPTKRNPETIKLVYKLAVDEAQQIGIKQLKLVCKKDIDGMCEYIISLGGRLESESYNEIDHYPIQRFLMNLE